MALSLLITGYSICTDQAGRTSSFIEDHFPLAKEHPVEEYDTDPTTLPTTCLIFVHLIAHIIGGQLVTELLKFKK
ncbi:hypothetical protein MFLAVUS_005214 [Mucor flavus]|uniref:Uncharacterized protein n=1 Tax=Mucor flavus TaxID=439312 RepID=A0ABP9YY30_9FUNG